MKKKCFIFSFLIAFIDQFIKYIIDKSFLLSSTKNVIGSFLAFTKVYNYGASWSILIGKRILLIVIALFIFIFLLFYQKKVKKSNANLIVFSFIYGGLIGNLIDRIFRGYVIDYIKISFGNYTYPIFNLADTFLVIGFIILIISDIKGDGKDEIKSTTR